MGRSQGGRETGIGTIEVVEQKPGPNSAWL